MSSKIRISAAAVLALTFTALLVTNRPAYRTPALPVSSTSTSITFTTPPISPGYDAMGTFATEKLKVTSTAADAIVSSGGMQMLGPLSITGGALNMNTHLINNVVDPASPQDAATKAYVDAATSGAISGSGTANTLPKFTGASAIGDSQVTDDGTTVAIGGADLTINTTTNTLDWQGGFLTIAGSGSLIIGNSGGTPVVNFIVSATTGNVTMNAGDLSVAGGTVNVGSGAVILAPAGTVASTGAITADGGLRVFDVAGNGLTSTTNTVHIDTVLGGGITVNPDSIQMTFCAANQIPQMNAGGTAWTCAAPAAGTITGSGTVNTLAKFTAGTAIGNTTLTDDGTTVAVNGNKFTVAVSTGNTLVAGTLDVTSDFKVNTNKFTVNGVSGDTTLAGALTVATNRLTVNATTGDTAALGALTADGGLRVFDVAGTGMTSSTNTVNVIALAGGGLTANADSMQMTFCAANQIPQMNAGGTAWTCAAPAAGTIGGSITASGVVYASGANTAATDATNLQYYQPEQTLNVGATAVTNCGAGACNTALNVTSATTGVIPVYSWNTSTSGYSGYAWNNTASVQQGSMGFANSAVSITAYRNLNFFSSPQVDYIFGEDSTGTVINRIGMTAGSASSQWANGSSAAVGAASTGKFIYNSTTNTFRVSLNGGAYTDVITGAVAANTIPKSNNSTTGVLTASTITDNGTTVSTTLPFTSSGTVTGLFLSGDVAGSAPTVGTCGTTPTQPAATDTNVTGSFTTGSGGGGTSCTLTFAGTAANAPQCYLLPANAGAAGPFQSSSTTTTATWSATLVASTPYRYICLR